MSLGNSAVVGAIWSAASRLGVRLIGLVSTLIITRFLEPDVMGEVGVAVVVVLTGQFASTLAFGQYIVVKSGEDRERVFHAFLFSITLTLIAAGVLLLLSIPLGLTRYLPVLVLAMVLERMARIPESLALRDLRFKLFSVVTAMSELAYIVVSLGMVMLGFGGESIVWANVAQYGLRLVWFSAATDRREWLTPCPLQKKLLREIVRFGIPIAIGNIAHYCSTSWDRLVIQRLFGSWVHGIYGLSKQLSQVPADNVGDAVADILMPSFVRMSVEEARVAVVRASHLVAIIVFPLAAGVAVVSPTLVATLFTAEWQPMAMPLTLLAAVTLIDPMGDNMASYLKARNMEREAMVVQVFYLISMLLATYLLGSWFGLEGACFGVGVGIMVRALSALYVASSREGVSISNMLIGLARVGFAAGLMSLSVILIREVLTSHFGNIYAALAVEIGTGALTYPIFAFLVANPITMDVIHWIKNRRSAGDDESSDEDESGDAQHDA